MEEYRAAGLGNDWPFRINVLREKFLVSCLEAQGFDVVVPDRSRFYFGVSEGPDRGWPDDEYRRVHGLGVADDLERLAEGWVSGDIRLRDGGPSAGFAAARSRCIQEAESKVEEAHRLWWEVSGAASALLGTLYSSQEWVEAAKVWQRCMKQEGFSVGSPVQFVSDFYKAASAEVEFDGRLDPRKIPAVRVRELALAEADVRCRTALVVLWTRVFKTLADGVAGQQAAALDAELRRLEGL